MPRPNKLFTNNKDGVYLLVILLIFFTIRVVAASFINAGVTSGSDSVVYNEYALTALKDFSWLYSSDFSGSKREPIYPIFLAITYFMFGKENFIAVYILQALINTITIFLIYKLAQKIFNTSTAVIALFWSGLYVIYIWFSNHLLREALACFFFALFFYIFYIYYIENFKKKIKIFQLSFIYFLLIHTDTRYLYLIPCILGLFIIYQHFYHAVKQFFIFILILVILSIPWAVRNYIVYNNFVLVSTHYFYPGLSIVKQFKYKKALDTKRHIICRNPDYPTEEERGLIKKGLNPNSRSPEEIIAIKKDAYRTTTFWGRRWFSFRELWRPFMLHGIYTPGGRFINWSLRHNIATAISYGLTLPFAFIGVVLLAKKRNKIAWFFILPICFHTLTHLLIYGETRYRVPIDMFLIILAGYGVSLVYNFSLGIINKP